MWNIVLLLTRKYLPTLRREMVRVRSLSSNKHESYIADYVYNYLSTRLRLPSTSPSPVYRLRLCLWSRLGPPSTSTVHVHHLPSTSMSTSTSKSTSSSAACTIRLCISVYVDVPFRRVMQVQWLGWVCRSSYFIRPATDSFQKGKS